MKKQRLRKTFKTLGIKPKTLKKSSYNKTLRIENKSIDLYTNNI